MPSEKSIAIQQTRQRETGKTGPGLPEKLSPVTAASRFFFSEIRHRFETGTVLLQLQVKPRFNDTETQLKRWRLKNRNSRMIPSTEVFLSLTHIQSM